MKNTIMLSAIVSVLVLTSIIMVSAVTVVAGRVYDNPNFEDANAVSGATVTVNCTHYDNDVLTSRSELSQAPDGTYLVEFTNEECDLGDVISVSGYHPDYGSGVGDGKKIDIDMAPADIALGVSNIALIPEFGFFIGTLTLLSAVGVFFLVRRN